MLYSYQVTDKVGPVKNDGPELVQPLDEHKSSISHFLKPADIKDEISKDLSPHVEKVYVFFFKLLLFVSLT